MDELQTSAARLAAQLRQTRTRIVFAESCTCGLLASALGEIPGISEWLCGSAVVYQEATKTSWLGIPPEEIARDGVVSEAVARRMAIGVLAHTPHAGMALSVTGHLGPNAPRELDGVVHAAIAFRGDGADRVMPRQVRLDDSVPDDGRSLRSHRRIETARLLLEWAATILETSASIDTPVR